MDLGTLVLGVAMVLAIGNVLPAWMLAWGLAGGDGEPANPFVGVVSLVTALTAPATALLVLGLAPWPARVVVIGVVAGVAVLVVAQVSRWPDRSHAGLWLATGITAVTIPLGLAAWVDVVALVGWREVVVASGPVMGVVTALALVATGVEDAGADGLDLAVVAAGGSLLAVPVLLAVLAA